MRLQRKYCSKKWVYDTVECYLYTFKNQKNVDEYLERIEDNIIDILFDLDNLPEFYLKEGITKNFLNFII